MRYTVGPELIEDSYHVDIIKGKLTRTLPVIMPDVVDELEHAVSHYIEAGEEGERHCYALVRLLVSSRLTSVCTEWTAVSVMYTMHQIVARASNRVFVGVPLCKPFAARVDYARWLMDVCFIGRNKEYLDMAIRFTRDVSSDRLVMNRVPRFLKPYVLSMHREFDMPDVVSIGL